MDRQIITIGILALVLVCMAGSASGVWWNSAWLKAKNQCVTTYTNDEFVFWFLGNDTDINSSAGYPMAVRILENNATEIPYANATDDALGTFGVWTQVNGSARTACYTIYYDNAAANYPHSTGLRWDTSSSWAPCSVSNWAHYI